MLTNHALRVAPSADGVSIWSTAIFRDAEASPLRDFLARAFSVPEVAQVELRRAKSFARVRFESATEPASIWRKLGQALRIPAVTGHGTAVARAAEGVDADILYLGAPPSDRVRVSRVGKALTTWKVQHHHGAQTVRIAHPRLRHRRDIAFRLEEALTAIAGIEGFRTSLLTGTVTIHLDLGALTVENLTRELEKAWPQLLDGLDGPPSRTRLVAATGLLGLAFTGQYLVPAVRPVAVAGVAIYGSPNVVDAAKDLRRGEVGLAALYSTGLALMLVGGMPFTSTVMATLMQLWPHLGRAKLVRSQRRIFAAQRRLPLTARLARTADLDAEVHVDEVVLDDLVLVRGGDVVPVDGRVEQGLASVIEGAPFGAGRAEDRAKGDAITAGTLILDGRLTLRVERTGAQTAASYLTTLLPHAQLPGMPCALEAERIANRNAKPALVLAAASFALTRTLRVSQAVLRPDYATAPRLSAQLATLRALAEALQRGVVFRNPAALDRLAEAELFVLDDSLDLTRRAVEVASVRTARGISPSLVIGHALAAERATDSERGGALAAHALGVEAVYPAPGSLIRGAGTVRYRDEDGGIVEVMSPQRLAEARIGVPGDLRTAPTRRTKRWNRRERAEDEPVKTDDHPSLRPLWVLRNGTVIGVVTFARSGASIARQTVNALKAQHARASFMLVSQRGDAQTGRLAESLGIEAWHGGMRTSAKVDLIRGLGRKAIWVGDGSERDLHAVLAASAVSISVAPAAHLRDDLADILLPYRELPGLLDVMEVGLAHARRLARDYHAVYATNLLGIVGAFAARFGSLQAGLLSQLGAALVYTRHARALDRLAATLEGPRAELARRG